MIAPAEGRHARFADLAANAAGYGGGERDAATNRSDGRPALLLGMNALRGFDKVSIDFATRRVHFVVPGSSMSNHIEFATN